jgi:two-component system sensor histidine kinase MprB
MTLRRRVGMAAAAAVAIAAVLVAGISYFEVRTQLRGQVDNALRAQANAIEHRAGLNSPFPSIPASAGGPAPYAEVVLADGTTYGRQGDISLPVNNHVLAVAAGNSRPYMADFHVGGSHLRALAFQIPGAFNGQPVAVVLARPLNSIDNVLSRLRLILIIVCLGAVVLAVVLGRIAARRVLAPLSEVEATALHIEETEDLASRIHVHSDDEVGRLAHRFNAMLERLEASRAALDQSVLSQRQLVADASHELRTPITSLRTNIELLLEHEEIGEDERRRILSDVLQQTSELTTLIGDLIELARGEMPDESLEDVRLDDLVAESVDRSRRNFPDTEFRARLEPVALRGAPERLARAVNNLLDNAARHSVDCGTVEVTVDSEGVHVRDHGSGIAEHDLPHVFERFYRGADARRREGSGLGLAIVKQVAEQHHGSVDAVNCPDGGALFTLRLPVSAAGESAPGPDSPPGRPDDPTLPRSQEAFTK